MNKLMRNYLRYIIGDLPLANTYYYMRKKGLEGGTVVNGNAIGTQAKERVKKSSAGMAKRPNKEHQKQYKDRIRQMEPFVRVLITTILLAIILTPISQLLSSNNMAANAANISENYPSQGNFPVGTLVSIKQTEPVSIELAHTHNQTYLTGVIVAEEESLLNINRDGGVAYVATSGDVEVFVSDINGDIKAGDFIGASWLAGVAMLADQSFEQRLLGVALQDFSAGSQDTHEVTGVDTPSGPKDVNVGKIVVRMIDRDVGTGASMDVSGLEALAQRVAGQNVSYTKVLMGAGIFIISVIISGVFLANAIRGSFISLGRNPLAHESIFTSLIQISGVSIGLVIIGAFLAYLVLIL